MSNWNMPQAGPVSTDLEKPVLVFQSGADINAVYQGLLVQQQAETGSRRRRAWLVDGRTAGPLLFAARWALASRSVGRR